MRRGLTCERVWGAGRQALENWRDVKDMKLLNLCYDLTPAESITLVITVCPGPACAPECTPLLVSLCYFGSRSCVSPHSLRVAISVFLLDVLIFLGGEGLTTHLFGLCRLSSALCWLWLDLLSGRKLIPVVSCVAGARPSSTNLGAGCDQRVPQGSHAVNRAAQHKFLVQVASAADSRWGSPAASAWFVPA